MTRKYARISHADSGHVIAEGPIGWAITPFEGNLYIGGNFTQAGGSEAKHIEEWTGSTWKTLDDGVNSTVNAARKPSAL